MRQTGYRNRFKRVSAIGSKRFRPASSPKMGTQNISVPFRPRPAAFAGTLPFTRLRGHISARTHEKFSGRTGKSGPLRHKGSSFHAYRFKRSRRLGHFLLMERRRNNFHKFFAGRQSFGKNARYGKREKISQKS